MVIQEKIEKTDTIEGARCLGVIKIILANVLYYLPDMIIAPKPNVEQSCDYDINKAKDSGQ